MSITIEAGKAFFWSDTHFFHKAAAYARGYDNVVRMNEDLIKAAQVVPEDGTLFLLGDVSFGKFDETKAVLGRIPGKKVLVMGNHDSGLAKHLEKLFDEVHHLLRVKVVEYVPPTGRKEKLAEIVCCHYPLLVWDKMHHGTWHLHGHCHGSLQHPGKVGKMLDVGCDEWLWPLSYSIVKRELDSQPIVSYDHHKPERIEGDWTL